MNRKDEILGMEELNRVAGGLSLRENSALRDTINKLESRERFVNLQDRKTIVNFRKQFY